MSPLWPLLLLSPGLLLVASRHNLSVRVLDGGMEERSLTLGMDAANSTIEVTWQQWDGPLLSSLLHTAQHLQAHSALLLPERELGQTRTLRLCFVTHGRVDTIPIADMMNIRQSDAGGLKSSEEERSMEVLSNLRALRSPALSRLPASIRAFCSSADVVAMPHEDVTSFWGSELNERTFLWPPLYFSSLPLPCHVSVCLLWLPCALTCKPPALPASPGASRPVEERSCGVRICRHCFRFELESSPSARCS